jgi:hypothetical protein
MAEAFAKKYGEDRLIVSSAGNKPADKVNPVVMEVRARYRLGDFHVFKTSEFGRHVICIDALPLREALDVVYASTCDEMFKRGVRINDYRTWILRNWEKGERGRPQYLRTIESPYNGQRLQSQVHAEFLKAFFGAKVRLVNPDGNDEIEINEYNTSSKVTAKELEKEVRKHKS